jgi:hypothetical protein
VEASDFDEHGWAVSLVQPLPRARAYTLFATEPDARFDIHVLVPVAKRQLDLSLEVTPKKQFRLNAYPNADLARITVSGGALTATSSVLARLVPSERAADLRARALTCRGAGMDALVRRARKVMQVGLDDVEGDPRAVLAVSAILIAAFLAAAMPPEEDALYGTKGAKERWFASL